MWLRIWILVIKELQQVWKNPQSRQLLIVPVLLQLLIFPFAVTLEVKDTTLGIMNEDGGAVSIELIQRVAAASSFEKIKMIYSHEELQRTIDSQESALVLRFPQEFTKNILQGSTSSIQVLLDGRRSNSAQIAFSYVQEVVLGYALEKRAVIQFDAPNNNEPTLSALRSQVDVRYAYNPNLHYHWFVLPCLVAIIATIGCLVVTALSLAREKEEGTFEQLLVTPLTAGYILVGKTIPGILVGMGQGFIIALCAILFYKVPMSGGWGLLILAMFCYALSVIGVGLFISALCSTQQQAFLGVFSYMVPSVILSGFLAPVENMPPFLYGVSQINPLTHFIGASQGIFLKYFSFAQVWPYLWPMLLISVVTITAAYTLFYKRTTM